MFGVSAAKYLLKEKRFLLMTATTIFAVFTLFTAPLSSTITFTLGSFTEVAAVGGVSNEPYYFIRQASAQERERTDVEPAGEVDEPPQVEEPPPSSPPRTCDLTTEVCPVLSEDEGGTGGSGTTLPPVNATALPPECTGTLAGTFCPPPAGENVTAVPQTNQTTEANAFGQTEPAAIICGRVFNDRNQNGNQDGGEPGIEGFTVRLGPASDGANIIGDSFKTDKFGNYCVGGTRTHTGGMDVSFIVTVVPPVPPVVPGGNAPDEGTSASTEGEPLSYTPSTGFSPTVTFKESDGFIREVNFGFGVVQQAAVSPRAD